KAGEVVEFDHAQLWFEGRERIVGDLRPRRRDARDQRRLAGIRESHQADIGEQFQLEPQAPLFARLTGLVFGRSLVRRRGKTRIALASPAALGRQESLARRGEVEQSL